jgi:hypothetical protein
VIRSALLRSINGLRDTGEVASCLKNAGCITTGNISWADWDQSRPICSWQALALSHL